MAYVAAFSRRTFGLGGCAAVLASEAASARPSLSDAYPFAVRGIPPGTIVISQRQRRLYLTQPDGSAVSYPVAIGKSGKSWSGWASIASKHVYPAWSPPADVKRDLPHLPNVIPGGARNNPMGARALMLDRSEIAIHGTSPSMRASVGTAASYGCIRMYNEDVVDLFDRVRVGTRVLSTA